MMIFNSIITFRSSRFYRIAIIPLITDHILPLFSSCVCSQTDKMLLLRFLKVNEFNVEKAQKLLLVNLEVRKNNPAIFLNRDILSEEHKRASTTIQLIPMKKCNSQNHNITIFRIADPNPNVYDPIEVARFILAEMDARFVMCEGTELRNGEVGICDLTGYSFRHMLKVLRCLPTFSGYMKYTQEALPSDLVQTHFVNASSIVHRLLSIMKPFMKKEVIDSIKVHTNLEDLYDYIPRELLPNEFGGTAGNLSDLRDEWVKKLLTKR